MLQVLILEVSSGKQGTLYKALNVGSGALGGVIPSATKRSKTGTSSWPAKLRFKAQAGAVAYFRRLQGCVCQLSIPLQVRIAGQ